jgi:hypothetical protein
MEIHEDASAWDAALELPHQLDSRSCGLALVVVVVDAGWISKSGGAFGCCCCCMFWTLFFALVGGCAARVAVPVFHIVEDVMYELDPGGTTMKLPSANEFFIRLFALDNDAIELPISSCMSMFRSWRSNSIISSTGLFVVDSNVIVVGCLVPDAVAIAGVAVCSNFGTDPPLPARPRNMESEISASRCSRAPRTVARKRSDVDSILFVFASKLGLSLTIRFKANAERACV